VRKQSPIDQQEECQMVSSWNWPAPIPFSSEPRPELDQFYFAAGPDVAGGNAAQRQRRVPDTRSNTGFREGNRKIW
jgi:hypothetical protein